MHILYFVTAHGYGHGVRTCAIANEFSNNVRLTLKTALPENFFREELKREFSYQFSEFDCGCVQLDSMNIDKEKTFRTYAELAEKNSLRLDRECDWCVSNKVDCIVSDITPFAFEIAKTAGIPSVGVTNFTWYDIYREYECEWFRSYLDKIYAQYLMCDNFFALEPSCEMSYMKNRKSIPVVARSGKNIRDKINRRFGIADSKKIGLIYAGNYGINGIDWKKLEQYSDWEFVGIYPFGCEIKNYHLVEKNEFPFQNLTASVDVVISKVGYGILSECFVNGKPLIYPSRENFSEYQVLEKAIRKWGGGYHITDENFYLLNWGCQLDAVVNNVPPAPVKQNGALYCASEIENTAIAFQHNNIH